MNNGQASSTAPEINSERLLASFLELVQIGSPSLKEAAMAAHCRQALEDIGCQAHLDGAASQTGSDTGNVIATLAAAGGHSGRIYLSAHMDTVEPGFGIEPVIADGVIVAAGQTILGGDDKVGVAAIIEALTTLQESGLPHPEIGVLLSTCEEIGLKGSQAMDSSGFGGEPCFVLDADGEPGGVIIGAPFHVQYEARFIGKASHAGVSPEKGISAILMAANAVTKLPVGRLDEGSTANVGTIQGGSADNVIAESCVITGEFRAMEIERSDQIKAQVMEILESAAAQYGGEVQMGFDMAYPGFKLSEDDELVRMVSDIALQLGLTPEARYTGGGSDANIFAGKGLNPLVPNTGMTDVHSQDESLKVADLENLARMLLAIALSY